MDRKDAERLVETFVKASTLCDECLQTIKVNDSLGQAKVFLRLAGEFLGHSYTNVLAPLWKAYPDLEPPHMKEPLVQPELVLSPASQEALRAFLSQARAALRLVEGIVPPDECEKTFAFGGLPEVESAVVAIEDFLTSPRYRDQKTHT